MSSKERPIVREVLATMVDDAPPPLEFGKLTETRLMQTSDRRRTTPPVAALAGFAVVLAIVGAARGRS